MRGVNEYSATNRQHWHHNLVAPAPPARTLESRSPDLWQRTPVTQVMTVAFLCSRWQDFALFPAAGGACGYSPQRSIGGFRGTGGSRGARPPGTSTAGHCEAANRRRAALAASSPRTSTASSGEGA